MANADIQNAFLDGMLEIYSTMFSDKQIQLQLLDDASTVVNIYKESVNKVYQAPLNLIGRISLSSPEGVNMVEVRQTAATILIPTKELITHEIPHTTDVDLTTLKKGKFVYDGFDWIIDLITPTTFVADIFLVYKFVCHQEKKSSVK